MRNIRLALPLVALALVSPASALASHALFISEYIEGTSNNKAIEIYNPTGSPVNLSGYAIRIYSNGSATVSSTILLSAVSLASGDVYVVSHNLASFAGSADQTSGSLSFNGDDAVTLYNGVSEIDVIGQTGFDPGTEWGTGLQSTADNTLRRDAAVCEGDINGGDAFNPATEWTGFATDTFGDLGTHSSSCIDVPGASGWTLVGLSAMLLAGAMFTLRRRVGAAA